MLLEKEKCQVYTSHQHPSQNISVNVHNGNQNSSTMYHSSSSSESSFSKQGSYSKNNKRTADYEGHFALQTKKCKRSFEDENNEAVGNRQEYETDVPVDANESEEEKRRRKAQEAMIKLHNDCLKNKNRIANLSMYKENTNNKQNRRGNF